MASCVFGPVPSRRFGRSLGVDLTPRKTCTYDCVYCQVGLTTRKTIERKEWIPLDTVVSQIADKLETNPDVITLSGSGEPTLYSRLGELIDRVKDITPTPLVVLTNGSLLWMPDVRKDLLRADIVAPSLDAPGETFFQYINRPHPALHYDQVLNGLIQFRKEYKGQIWLEVLLVGGITGIDDVVKRLREPIREVNPNRIHLNTVVRPPAETFAHAVPMTELERFAKLLGDRAEVIADYQTGTGAGGPCAARLDDVLAMLARRPCTIEDIAAGFSIPQSDVQQSIDELLKRRTIETESRAGKVFYKVRS